jgi:hypothetical protein
MFLIDPIVLDEQEASDEVYIATYRAKHGA